MRHQLTDRQIKIKNEFLEHTGYWSDTLERLLVLDETFFETYVTFMSKRWKRSVLEVKTKELILIALHSSVTHLNENALRKHVKNALKLGATKEEIMEVFQLTSALGMHTLALGVPILVNELEQHKEFVFEPLSEQQRKLKQDFIEKMGYWNEFREYLVAMNETYFQAYFELLTYPWDNGVLEPKVKELIYIAIDSSTTHLYEVGLRAHVKKALSFGATMEEILEVYELTSTLGLQTAEVGATILYEELDTYK